MAPEVPVEIEVKLSVDGAEETASHLEAAGARLLSPPAFEDNRLFDLPGRPLTRSGRLLRVRETGGRAIVTAKAPAPGGTDGRYKVRREEEIVVPDAASFVALLEVAGFEKLWRYQKVRRKYAWEGAEVVIDETAAGTFLEIEGEPAVIDRLVEQLGDHAGPRETATYREVWEAHCARQGLEVGDMLLPEGSER